VKKIKLMLLTACLWNTGFVQADTQSINLIFGLTQPLLLGGGNIEINYLTDNWVFEYSHGFDLDLHESPDLAMTSEERSQGLKIHLPYSTGGGIGYRFTKEFNLRVEFKQHKYEVTHPSNERMSYTTQDLGIGAYYFYEPLRNYSLIIVPSIRYWPTINTSLDNDQYTFSNGDVHKAHEFGLFANVSVGWKF